MTSPLRAAAPRRTATRALAAALLASVAALSACSSPGRTSPVASAPEPPVDVVPTPAPTTGPPPPSPADLAGRPKIVAFGDSLTAGFGLEKSQSYPAVLQRLLDERGYHYEVVNAGVSGETSAGGVRRADHALEGDVAVVIVELGGNDGLRGLPPKDLEKNLQTIVEKAKARKAKVLVAGMEAPPYLGEEYTSDFREVYARLAKRENVALMPFLLVDVAGKADLNQTDGIHPNIQGAVIVANNVLKSVEPLLSK